MTIAIVTILFMPSVILDSYLFETLMADLVGHDRSPAAFLVYMHLASQAGRGRKVRRSYQDMAVDTGLSRSAVQRAVRHLVGRKLLSAEQAHATDTPTYAVLRPWKR